MWTLFEGKKTIDACLAGELNPNILQSVGPRNEEAPAIYPSVTGDRKVNMRLKNLSNNWKFRINKVGINCPRADMEDWVY